MLASIMEYSREMEQEADLGGVSQLARAGYDSRQASVIWEQLRAEMDATAAARNTKSRKDKNGGLFASHPPSAERVAYLQAEAGRQPGNPAETGAARHRQAMARYWPEFLDDQLKRNDFGAGEYLLASLAADGWTPWLLYARGELHRRRAAGDDLARAVGFYSEAIAGGGELPELWRGRGLAQIKSGQTDAGKSDLREYLRRAPDATDKGMILLLSGESQ